MQLLLVLPAPLCASLTVGRMSGWKHIRQEGWRLNLLKRPRRPLKDEVLATPLPLTALAYRPHRGARSLVQRGAAGLGEESTRSGGGGAQAHVQGKRVPGASRGWDESLSER